MSKRVIEVDGIEIEVGNEEKILFPKKKITKGELINYYYRISRFILPYIKDRPLTMQRFPNGIAQEGFYQKNVSDYFPSWITTKKIEKQENGQIHYIVCNNTATLVYLANQACITLHVWLSKIDKLHHPDKIIFDLDPAGKAQYKLVRWAAKKLKMVLDYLGLNSFVMLTGSRGIHIVVPLKRELNFDKVNIFANEIAAFLVMKYPTKCTLEMRNAKRGDRILIDTLRNLFGQTGVAPYSVRAREGAPVATPITWDELFKKRVKPQQYTVKNIFRRLAKIDDPWKNFYKSMQSLTSAHKKLDQIIGKEHDSILIKEK